MFCIYRVLYMVHFYNQALSLMNSIDLTKNEKKKKKGFVMLEYIKYAKFL